LALEHVVASAATSAALCAEAEDALAGLG